MKQLRMNNLLKVITGNGYNKEYTYLLIQHSTQYYLILNMVNWGNVN